MKFWYQTPHASIAGYVRTVLILEGNGLSDPSRLPLFTNGMPTLLCETEKDARGNEIIKQLRLFGKSAPPECWEIKENTTLISYFFKPFVLGSVFGIPAKELVDKPVDLNQWNSKKAVQLTKEILDADSTSGKVEILNCFLMKQLQHNQTDCEVIRLATDQIMYQPDTEVLSRTLEELNLTERTFQRIFKKYVGITPNQYRRVCQFYFAFEQLRDNQFDKLTDIAFENGYADQSHFIRSFREFAQTTPNNYLRFGLAGKKQ